MEACKYSLSSIISKMRQLYMLYAFSLGGWTSGERPKRLGHKGLEIILHRRPAWTPKLLLGIKIESYCVKHEAPLKFTLGAYSTGSSAYSLLYAVPTSMKLTRFEFLSFSTHPNTHTHKWFCPHGSYPPLSRNTNESMTHICTWCSIFGKKIIFYLMSHSKQASHTCGSTYCEILVAYFLVKRK